MKSGRRLENKYSIPVLTTTLVLLISLLVLSCAVHAGANVRIWMNKDTYNLGERATVYFDFPSSGRYTLVQIEPTRETIISDVSASAGRNRLGGTMERPTGRKRIKVIFEDNHGNRHTATTSYYVQGGSDSSGGQNQGGSEEGPSLSYFKSRNPSQAGDVARNLQNQVHVIRPGDSNYHQLERNLESKSYSLNFSLEQQNLESKHYSFGTGGMEFSVDPNKQNTYSLERSLSDQGVAYLGKQGGNDIMLMGEPNPGGGSPGGGSPGGGSPGGGSGCIVIGTASPIFVCLPAWVPFPLPLPWLIWILMFV